MAYVVPLLMMSIQRDRPVAPMHFSGMTSPPPAYQRYEDLEAGAAKQPDTPSPPPPPCYESSTYDDNGIGSAHSYQDSTIRNNTGGAHGNRNSNQPPQVRQCDRSSGFWRFIIIFAVFAALLGGCIGLIVWGAMGTARQQHDASNRKELFVKECESQGGVVDTGNGWYSCHVGDYQITHGATESYEAGKLSEIVRDAMEGVAEALRSIGLDADGVDTSIQQ